MFQCFSSFRGHSLVLAACSCGPHEAFCRCELAIATDMVGLCFPNVAFHFRLSFLTALAGALSGSAEGGPPDPGGRRPASLSGSREWWVCARPPSGSTSASRLLRVYQKGC